MMCRENHHQILNTNNMWKVETRFQPTFWSWKEIYFLHESTGQEQGANHGVDANTLRQN